ncbi:hypothetical protein IID10_03295, partial [candidate division KSB1 bacterium]|nr:hypothetical protein [candidate division KSB1 bacterium]
TDTETKIDLIQALPAPIANFDTIPDPSDILVGQTIDFINTSTDADTYEWVFDYDGTTASMDREVEGGKEKLTVNPPFVVGIQEGVCEPRIPSMRGIMSARTKPLTVVEPIDADSFASVVSYELPPPKSGCTYVEADNAEQLIELLHTEAKAL